MTDAAPQRDTPTAAPFPGRAAIAAAFRALTCIGPGPTGRVDASAVYYPLVGLALGLLWLAVDRAVSAVAGRIVASIAVALVAALATGGRPLRALARTIAALPCDRASRLAVIESGRGNASDNLCAAIVLAMEVAVLCALVRYRPVGLVFAPVLGTCSMVVLAVGSRAARADGRRLKFAPSVTFREFGLASTATFAMVFLTTEFLGLLLVLATAAFTIAARVLLHRWIDGVNETTMLATGEAAQLMILALLVALR
jgi:cobalamin synthase